MRLSVFKCRYNRIGRMINLLAIADDFHFVCKIYEITIKIGTNLDIHWKMIGEN
jgi:hypothetical protein